MEIRRIGTSKDRLGEAVLWDAPSQRLYWADASGGVIHRLDPATDAYERWAIPAPLGALCVTRSGRLLLVLPDGAYYYDTDSGAMELYAQLPDKDDALRLNDCKIDRQGRMVVGDLYLKYRDDAHYRGRFYTLGSDRVFRPFDDQVGITNGPCFSPAGDVLYIADTAKRIIWAYDYDDAPGAVSGRRMLADDSVLQGMPDGGTVDAEGCLWFTIMTRGVVLRLSPEGRAIDTIAMPINPTSVAFGGPDLDVMYVTSISQSVNIDVTAEGAGGLFAVTGLGIKGIAEVRFAD